MAGLGQLTPQCLINLIGNEYDWLQITRFYGRFELVASSVTPPLIYALHLASHIVSLLSLNRSWRDYQWCLNDSQCKERQAF